MTGHNVTVQSCNFKRFQFLLYPMLINLYPVSRLSQSLTFEFGLSVSHLAKIQKFPCFYFLRNRKSIWLWACDICVCVQWLCVGQVWRQHQVGSLDTIPVPMHKVSCLPHTKNIPIPSPVPHEPWWYFTRHGSRMYTSSCCFSNHLFLLCLDFTVLLL